MHQTSALLGRLTLSVAVAAMLNGCAGRQLHGVGAQRDVAPVAAILDDAPQSLGLAGNPKSGRMPAVDARALQVSTSSGQTGSDEDVAAEVVTFAPRRYPPMPDMGGNRAEALDEIRTKAAAEHTAKPNIFKEGYGSASPLAKTEQKRLSGSLDSDVRLIDERISAEEIAKKQAEAEWLRKRGKSHYEETLNEIEK